MILKLSVNNQSVESSGITKDYKDALCEYVWNSFEANATAVAIDCIPNELTGRCRQDLCAKLFAGSG